MAPKYKWLSNRREEHSSLMAENGDNCSCSVTSEFPTTHHSHLRECLKPWLATLKDVILMAFAIVGLASLLQALAASSAHLHSEASSTMPTRTKSTSCNCGNSTAQAVALGCKYDSLAAAWLPEHCRDDELTAEFERSGPGVNGKWTYWSDLELTHEIGVEEIAQRGDSPGFRFYMSAQWHVVHCIFYWRKEHRARFNGKMIEPRSDNEAHIKHCAKIILGPDRLTVAGVELNADV